MKLLLDTHVALWLTQDDAQLSPGARELIRTAEEVFVSSISIWEVSIKVSIGKLPVEAMRLESQLTRDGIQPLPVTWTHARAVQSLPMLHRDPFDRMLIAQAMSEPLHLLTHDAALSVYSELVIVI